MHRSRLAPVLTFLLFAAVSGVHAQAIGEKLDGPDSDYTDGLVRVLKAWPSKRFGAAEAPRGVELTCIATPGEEAYVGILRRTTIRAPLSAVEDVLDDIAHYRDLFPGTVDVRVVSGSPLASRFATAWEQRMPVFFLPNVHYELSHVVDRTVQDFRVYRYKLRRSDRLLASDGMVVLEVVGPQTTQFTELGFFRPRPAPVPASLVWRESLRGAFLSNMAIKLKAENPEWSYGQVAAEGKRLLASESARLERCLADRHDATLRSEIASLLR